MALKAIVESTEGMDAAVAAEYTVQEDGTFALQVEAVGSLELTDTKGLKSALGKERAGWKAANEKLVRFGELDPVAAKDALAKVAEMADWNPEREVAEKVKAREKQLIDRHTAEKAEMLTVRKELEVQLEQNLITAVLTKSIVDAGGSPKLLIPYLRQRVRMRKTDAGKFVAEVLDEAGNPAIGDSDGNPTTMMQLVEENKADEAFAGAYRGTGSSGSGAGGTPSGGTSTPSKPSGKVKRIPASDNEAVNANIDAIANGTVVVDMDK